MMVFTTLFIAVIIVAGLYFVIRFIPWPSLSYALVGAVGIACFIPGDVHFRYVGIEVLGLGILVVWFHYRIVRKDGAQGAGRIT